MSLLLAGLDIPVVVPASVPVRDLRVVATGKGRVGDAPEYWEEVSVGPATTDDAPPSWVLRTIARRGCRPARGGGWTVDSGLSAAAAAAVGDLLLAQIPQGLSGEETLRRIDEATAVADALIDRLGDAETWARTTIDVDGSAFVLWVHRRAEGFVAVADLGPCLVTIHGRTPPETWAATLLAPADARPAFGTARGGGPSAGPSRTLR